MKAFRIIAIGLLAVVIYVLLPTGPRLHIYRLAKKTELPIVETVPLRTGPFTEGPAFLIKNNALYIHQFQTRFGLFDFLAATHRYRWSAKDIRALRSEHPEIEKYLPDPSREDGGVDWVTESESQPASGDCLPGRK